jgi:hypothetical protein
MGFPRDFSWEIPLKGDDFFSNFQIKNIYSSFYSDSQRLNAEDLMWFVGKGSPPKGDPPKK